MGFITRLAKRLAYTIAVVVAVGIVVVFGSRFMDGPSGILAGGAFSSGTLVSEEPDWSFAKDYDTVEFQLLDPARSRTTWIAVVDGRVFIPCGYMDTPWGRLWKQWPIQAEQQGEAILRVDDKLYNRQLVRIKQDPALAGVFSELARKYFPQAANNPELGASMGQTAIDNDSLWVFELVPRA